jgi:hypothetical protein
MAKLNKSTSTSKKMKSKGAGYSTTNRKGETTYYKSSKDAPGYSDTRDGKNVPVSAGIDIDGNTVGGKASQKGVINVDELGTGAPMLNLPSKPVPQGFDSAMPFDVTRDSLDASNARQNQLDAGYLQNVADLQMPSLSDEYAKAEKKAGIKQFEDTLSSYESQLKDISAQAQAQQLALEGQGRGQTGAFIGGEQARINREATIKALPIQAQADIAQGNLDRANSRLDKLFQIYQQDVQNQFQYKSKVVEATYSILTGAEQRRATQLLAIQKEKADTKKDNINYLRELSAEARDNGNTKALSMLSTIDPNSDKFESEVARASQMIRKPVAPTKRDTQVVGNQLIDMQTGAVIANLGVDSGQQIDSAGVDFSDPTQVNKLNVSDLTKAVMNGYAKTKELTPTQRGEVASELNKIGFNPNTYITKKLDTLVESWSNVPEDSKGVVQGLKFWERWTKPEVANFESNRTLLTREIARLFDVGVLSDQDVKSYTDAMPSRQDQSLDVVLNKTAGIGSSATGKSAGQNVGKRVQLSDGRVGIVGADGNTILDPVTGKPLE